ncbi:MAG: acetyl-CoA carboxylase biotin carboxylase subunit [Acidobacteria bacterium]|jgi:acetyl-CoA carboxylase biotin carboxylase subunit|nr:acetyl-CoA carboxylase biotin carboxylase subunit [Acidobacteriota bacterium]
MFRKVLIANRGEIALRIIWACKELGIKTVAVHSDVDSDSLHVRFADENVCIGPAPSRQSYLNINNLISAAEISNADAIHPGYGFLSESPEFARVCEACNITFIGPSPETIALMGNKAEAKLTMKAAGVPTIPGSDGPVPTPDEAKRLAADIGYPVILKASAGGGGKGMRVIRSEADMEMAFQTASGEAAAAFNNGDLYIEKYLENPRHIEIQILGDKHGNVIHLNERECSIQRKHQKLIEEAPSCALNAMTRKQMGEMAVHGAKAVNYATAGTIEFLLEDGKFYFMEMNTRIQVEHPVTENVCNLDLVKAQIMAAAGEKMTWRQKDIKIWGHSMECRINAEDPIRFIPSPGRITTFHAPGGPGVRVDTAAYAGYFVSPHYDSLIAKLIVRGPTRADSIMRMKRALESFIVEGIKTNIAMHIKIMDDPDFIAGNLSTRFMERYLPENQK